jgi:hypothetical protein
VVVLQQRTVKTAESYLVEDDYKNYNIQFLKVLLLSLNLILLCQNDLDRSFYDVLLYVTRLKLNATKIK